jgi:hypothetical protein
LSGHGIIVTVEVFLHGNQRPSARLPKTSAGANAIALSADQLQVFIVHAFFGGKIGSAGYSLPSTSNITIINNTNPIPPLG